MKADLPESQPAVVVALVGRQNSGKTSLVMQLTGETLKPVNFPGSSVDRGVSRTAIAGRALTIVDLPGLASLEAVSNDERVTVDFLRAAHVSVQDESAADVICAVVDASKLSVELPLVIALSALDKPLVIALNKADVARGAGRGVDAERLASALCLPVYETDGLHGTGVDALKAGFMDAAGRAASPVPLTTEAIVALAQPTAAAPPSPTFTDTLDRVLLSPWLGLPILGLIMYAVFQALFIGADPFMGLIEEGQASLSGIVAGAMAPGALRSLVIDGLINGVGSVVIFVPQIAFLMLFVALLEGTGYMARAAFLLDRPLSKVGLSGRSFVPMMSSMACAVPGVMATRIIDNERDRLTTILVSPLMTCSARLPVYVLLIGAFFPAEYGGLILLGMYVLGIVTAAVVALILRKTILRGPRSALMMELPVYQRPLVRVVWGQVWGGVREFLVMAGTVIFAASVMIWLLSYYPRPAELHAEFEAQRVQVSADLAAEPAALSLALQRLDQREAGAYMEQSVLSDIGRLVQPVFALAGWDWKTSVSVLAAFPARELIIPTLGILHNLGEADPGDFDTDQLGEAAPDTGSGLRTALKNARRSDGSLVFTWPLALGLLVFFALCAQCAATLAAIKRETHSWKWPVFTFTYMTAIAWVAAVLVYQIGTAFTT